MSLYIDKNNRAVSEMLSYVMLIIIALGLSVLVFVYLQYYVPKDKPKCIDDVSIYIKDISCDIGSVKNNLTVTLENNGLFDIQGVYVRFGEKGKSVLDLINDPLNNPGIILMRLSDPYNKGLAPQVEQSHVFRLSSTVYPAGNYTLEVQPAVFIDKTFAVCENAIVRQDVECK